MTTAASLGQLATSTMHEDRNAKSSLANLSFRSWNIKIKVSVSCWSNSWTKKWQWLLSAAVSYYGDRPTCEFCTSRHSL